MQIGSEMAALQEKTPKMDPKKRFFWKIPQDFELLKKVPQNIHQTGQFGWNRYIGIWNLSHGAFQGDVGRNWLWLKSVKIYISCLNFGISFCTFLMGLFLFIKVAHSGLNQGVRPSYDNFQISPRTLCTISTDCFAETPVTVSFDHISCTFWSINMRRFLHQMTNH